MEAPASADQAPAQPRSRLPARAHAWAAWFFFHFLCVFIYILPYPPYFDDRTLRMPEIQEEMGRFFGDVHRTIPVMDSPQELQAFTVKWLKQYMEVYFRVRRWFAEPYLELAGATQSWNMFGGTPPRKPKALLVLVRPRGEQDYELYRDFRWGTADHDEADFRHFKTHEILSMGGWDHQRQWYAEYWGQLWNHTHPDRPAEVVRMTYVMFTTPPPDQRLPDGSLDRKPQHLQDYNWVLKGPSP